MRYSVGGIRSLTVQRSSAIALFGLLIGLLSYPIYLLALAFIALGSSTPSDANNTGANDGWGGLGGDGDSLLRGPAYVCVAGDDPGNASPSRATLSGRRVIALGFALAVIPGVVGAASLYIAGRHRANPDHGVDPELVVMLVLLFVVPAIAAWAACLRRLTVKAPWGER